MRKFLMAVICSMSLLLLGIGERSWSGTTAIGIKGEGSLTENSCVALIEIILRRSCSSNQTSIFGPFVFPLWQGPTYAAGFYKLDNAPGFSNPGGRNPGGKAAPDLDGQINIDDRNTINPIDDLISGKISLGKTAYAFTAGPVGVFSGQAIWKSLTYTITPTTVDAASPNQFGGFDYIVASDGMPPALVEIASGVPFPTEGSATLPGFWYGPGHPFLLDTPGIATYEMRPGAGPNLGTTAVAKFKELTCMDIGTPGACASTINIVNDPDLDNLLLFIQTDSAGNIILAHAYAVRQHDLVLGFGDPNDSFTASSWRFAGCVGLSGKTALDCF